MSSRKKFTKGEGKYYFNVRTGHFSITINRETKKAATRSYHSYLKVGKDCEWLGKWDGRDFIESTPPPMENSLN